MARKSRPPEKAPARGQARNVYWRGYLKLSLVTCAVTLSPATTEGARLRFHTLNRRTGNRVVSRWIDSVTEKPLPEDAEARGYQRGEDDYVLIEDADLEAVQLDSSRTIDITTFIPEGDIGWIWREKPHFLMPSDSVGAEAFAVIRAAMAASQKVGIARLVLARRERAVLLEPRGKGIILWTLRFGDELRNSADYFEDIPEVQPDDRALGLLETLIGERSRDWDRSLLHDPVQDGIADLIEARRKGRKTPKAPAPEDVPEGKVIDIMSALRKSLAAEKRGR